MSVMANGWGSRDKARLTVKRTSSIPKQEESAMALNAVPSDEEIEDVKPIAVSSTMVQIPTSTKRSIVRLDIVFILVDIFILYGFTSDVVFLFHCYRLDNLIMEAITSLKEPDGSNKTTIAAYIEVVFYMQYS